MKTATDSDLEALIAVGTDLALKEIGDDVAEAFLKEVMGEAVKLALEDFEEEREKDIANGIEPQDETDEIFFNFDLDIYDIDEEPTTATNETAKAE